MEEEDELMKRVRQVLNNIFAFCSLRKKRKEIVIISVLKHIDDLMDDRTIQEFR